MVQNKPHPHHGQQWLSHGLVMGLVWLILAAESLAQKLRWRTCQAWFWMQGRCLGRGSSPLPSSSHSDEKNPSFRSDVPWVMGMVTGWGNSLLPVELGRTASQSHAEPTAGVASCVKHSRFDSTRRASNWADIVIVSPFQIKLLERSPWSLELFKTLDILIPMKLCLNEQPSETF